MYDKCQHAENKNVICDMCGANRIGDTIERRFIADMEEFESGNEETHTLTEMTQDGTILEITWDEIGSEIFSRTFQPSPELRMIMDGLKELN